MSRSLRPTLCAVALALTSLAAAPVAEAAVDAHGSARQVYVTGLKPRAQGSLVDKAGKTVAKKRASGLGALLFRNVKPGSGYRVSVGGEKSDALTVISNRAAPPSTDNYNQNIPSSGYGYLTTRDGTKLAINLPPPSDISSVSPTGPVPALTADGPNPTLIEYSGYGYANPAGPTNGIAIIANLMGFTVVDVDMRGTRRS